MGKVALGREVYVGTSAKIIEGVKVRNGAIEAARAVVIEDVPEMSLGGCLRKSQKNYISQKEKPW
jgi:acetyltransferase-like isoleucine patch superfamily enzyme